MRRMFFPKRKLNFFTQFSLGSLKSASEIIGNNPVNCLPCLANIYHQTNEKQPVQRFSSQPLYLQT